MHQLKRKTAFNSLVCLGTHANEVINGTYVTEQLTYNDLRLFVDISSRRKERQINCWEARKSCVMAATEFVSNFLTNISWDFCLHVWP